MIQSVLQTLSIFEYLRTLNRVIRLEQILAIYVFNIIMFLTNHTYTISDNAFFIF